MAQDIIIKNAKIVDGSGNPSFLSDIAVKNGKISKVSPKIDEEAEKIIDGTTLVACPGFIDMHSHSDYIIAVVAKAESFIRQGITTCTIGMCGDGLAPIPPDRVEDAKKLLMTISPLLEHINISWNTFEEYLAYLDKRKCPINLVPCVGYNNIRIAGGAGFENRDSTPDELYKMKDHVKEAMTAGAFGMSTGLIYAPQVYVKTEELIELSKVLVDYNGIYFSHIRGEGKNLVKSIQEFIEIVEKSGCNRGQIAHKKVAGKLFWGSSKDSLRLIEEANSRGLEITFDQYPYNRGMTSLKTLLPPWVHEGGKEKLLERIKDPKTQEKIKEDTKKGLPGWENFIHVGGFESVFIAGVSNPKWKDIEGKNIAEITKIRGKKDSWETLFNILIDEDTGGSITLESMGEEDIRRIMTNQYQMFGTDGAAIPNVPTLGKFHPRFYGTYPRVLGKYVREEKVLSLEDAIRRMTSFPAQKLGLKDRGLIKEGNLADIVLFNPDTVIDKATFDDPHQFPEGIPHVIVNGIIVVDNNKQLRKYPGEVIRRPT